MSEELKKQYARRDAESLGAHYLRHVEAMTAEGLHGKSEIAAELAFRDQQIESLAKFKAYVHRRLDEAGIPTDPDSPHKAEGCRIGGRLDIALNRETPGEKLAEAYDRAQIEEDKSPIGVSNTPEYHKAVEDILAALADWRASRAPAKGGA